MNAGAEEEGGVKLITVKGLHEYLIVRKSIFRREGIETLRQFWKTESERIRGSEEQLPSYPYFETTRVIEMLLVDGGSIFKDITRESGI